MRTIDWVDDAVEIIDQTALPGRLTVLRLTTVEELVAAIQRLAVRGAPALGVAGALGVALAARRPGETEDAVRLLATARPTAVNLAWGVRRAAARLPFGADAVLAEALAVRDEEIEASAAMATLGADLLTELCGDRPRLLTHCNTGALASVVGGTALGAVLELHRRDGLGAVVASETRPLLQGARLTAWELGRAGVSYRVAVDGAGPFLMARGEVDGVVLGADRICANGDVVNKIGSYAHALGAHRAGIPFVVVAPESTVDMATPGGDHVEIEDRGAAEVLSSAWSTEPAGAGTGTGNPANAGTGTGNLASAGGGAANPANAGGGAANPAFDVTPYELVTAIVTDRRVIRLDRGERV